MKHKIRSTPTNEQKKMFQEALAFYRSGNLDLAEKKYKKLINFFPNNIDLLTGLGTIALQKGRLKEGLEIINKSLIINPNQSSAHNNCGNALKELKRFKEALASYDRAIQLKPNNADAYSNRGLTLQEIKKTDEALASYDRAIEIKPDIDFLLSYSLFTKMQLCIWDNLSKNLKKLTKKIINNEKVAVPFPVLAWRRPGRRRADRRGRRYRPGEIREIPTGGCRASRRRRAVSGPPRRYGSRPRSPA